VGEGECVVGGRRLPGGEALRAAGLAPLALEPKEGLALINGTQLATAVGALAVAEALRLARSADVVGALSLDALEGTDVAFDPRIHAARPHPGQAASARNLVRLLAGSAVRESHRACGRVQDAYSLRCMPQVHGAARDAIGYAAGAHVVEMNSATDNPMVFADTGEILSGGNFHGQPVAIAADLLAIAAAELGAISERRTERLVNPALSGLPAFLAREGGLHSGLMMAHVTAAALASESKSLAHPASVDSIPTSAGKEDHVSMGPTAAWKAARVVANTGRVLAVELLAACEALDFRRPLRSSEALEAVHARVRQSVPTHGQDRVLGPEIEALAELLRTGAILAAAESACGTLE
jgi:histidine ammonia-lyase